jgi:hypothetical protein
MCDEASVAKVMVLSNRLPWGSEENKEMFSQDSWCPGRIGSKKHFSFNQLAGISVGVVTAL